MLYSEGTIRRFWSKVDKRGQDECWNWMAGCNGWGYGKMRLERQRIEHQAHRISYALAFGPFPEDLFVCHECDNPKCCNPRHLFLGTNLDNIADMIRKGRNRSGASNRSGEEINTAVLRAAEVREIRRRIAMGENNTEIAKDFGVTHGCVSLIRLGKTWRHIGA